MSGALAVAFLLGVFGLPMLIIVGSVLRNERWPAPREHHEFHCPRCACSYTSASSLAMHWTAQHTHQTALRLPCDGGPARSVR